MAHNVRIRPIGFWTLNSVVDPAEFEAIDAGRFAAPDFDAGGVWAPALAVQIGGAGLQVNGPFVVSGTGTGTVQTGGAWFFQTGTAATFVGTAALGFSDFATVDFVDDVAVTFSGSATCTLNTGTSLIALAGSTVDLRGDVFLKTGAVLTAESGADIAIEAGVALEISTQVDIESGASVVVKSGATVTSAAGALWSLNGATLQSDGPVVLQAAASLTLNGGATATLESGALETLESGSALRFNPGATLEGTITRTGIEVRSGTGGRTVDRITTASAAGETLDVSNDVYNLPANANGVYVLRHSTAPIPMDGETIKATRNSTGPGNALFQREDGTSLAQFTGGGLRCSALFRYRSADGGWLPEDWSGTSAAALI